MKAINISDAKAHLSALVSEIEKTGNMVVICKNGKAVADLVPHGRRRSRLSPHNIMKDISICYDPTEPLSEDEWGEVE